MFFTRFKLPPKEGVKYDPSEGRTQQQFRDECDINLTVKRYGDPNEFLKAMRVQNYMANMEKKPIYGDFSELPDLQESMNAVREAESMFMDLPAAVRERFGNDPVKLIQFVQDPSNYEEALRIGIVQKREETAPAGGVTTPSATSVADKSTSASTADSGEVSSHA